MTRCNGVILAAGRGSRLGALTESRPKCLVELGGRALLDRQLEALRAAGVDPVHVVVGYRRELIEARGVPTLTNAEWATSNMVASLMCALEHLEPPLIVSYADIVYRPSLVRRLLASEHALSITYDREWRSLWERRFTDPLSDAETFRIDTDGRVLEIGSRPRDVADVQGQFMGLLKLSATAVGWIRELVSATPDARSRLDSTGLLMRLIQSGRPVHGVPTSGGWCEVDDAGDLAVAQALLAEGLLEDSAEAGV